MLSDGARVSHTPGPRDVEVLRAALAPWRAWTRPRYVGLENVPREGAVLLVGNHTLFGLLDLPLMVEEIHRERGRWARGLAEHTHFLVPGWRDLLMRAGAVRGTRANCRALLAAGEAVLVYPGGGREVAKRKGEKYQLIWKQRLGFARMAVEAGCPIVPFASIGVEDAFDIVVDADHPLLRPVRAAYEALGGNWDIVPPLARGLGPTPLPRREQIRFAFGDPIDTTQWGGLHESERALRTVRDRTRDAVEDLLDTLLRERDDRTG